MQKICGSFIFSYMFCDVTVALNKCKKQSSLQFIPSPIFYVNNLSYETMDSMDRAKDNIEIVKAEGLSEQYETNTNRNMPNLMCYIYLIQRKLSFYH